MNVIIRLGTWIESIGKPKDNIEKLRKDLEFFCSRYQEEIAGDNAGLRNEIREKLDALTKRMGIIESSTASRVSVEEALNVLDKKIAALMVSSSFPSFTSVHDQEDPLSLLPRK